MKEYKLFWKEFHHHQKLLDQAFKRGDTFDVGYHLGYLHAMKTYGIIALDIPACRLEVSL